MMTLLEFLPRWFSSKLCASCRLHKRYPSVASMCVVLIVFEIDFNYILRLCAVGVRKQAAEPREAHQSLGEEVEWSIDLATEWIQFGRKQRKPTSNAETLSRRDYPRVRLWRRAKESWWSAQLWVRVESYSKIDDVIWSRPCIIRLGQPLLLLRHFRLDRLVRGRGK